METSFCIACLGVELQAVISAITSTHPNCFFLFIIVICFISDYTNRFKNLLKLSSLSMPNFSFRRSFRRLTELTLMQ